MGNLFGRKHVKKQDLRVTEQDKAVLQLKQQRDKLKQYQKKIAVQLEKDRQVAVELLREGRKDKAKLMLRKKKFQESLLNKTYGQLDNLEQLVHDLEFAQIEQEVVKGLEVGNKALKKLHEILSLEDVERIMDEAREEIEVQQEIDALLAGGLSQAEEEDVAAELEEILAQSGTVAENDVVADLRLPDVPTDELGRVKQKEKKKEHGVQQLAVGES